MRGKIAFFVVCALLVSGVSWYWIGVAQPTVVSHIAVDQLKNSDSAIENVRIMDNSAYTVSMVSGIFLLFLGAFLFWKDIGEAVKKFTAAVVLFGMLLCLPGCIPYDAPELQEIKNNETGFLLPLEGDTTQQGKFQSETFLESRKVAIKRVQIPHKWVQMGRWESDGKYVPTVRLVIVPRSPVVREWTGDPKSGTSATDQSIKVESKDSVGFKVGYSVAAIIKEEDAAKFLYWYPSADLANVMDTEVRSVIQRVTADECAKEQMDTLRTKKTEIVAAARKECTAYFAERGITITSVGMSEGFTYDNPSIQKAIDEVFEKQQLKVVALATFEAQAKTNERVLLEADAAAEKVQRVAKGEAAAKIAVATAEAQGITLVNKALAEAQSNPMLISLRSIEIQRSAMEKWDGKYPVYMMSMVGNGIGTPPAMLMQLPSTPSGLTK